MGITVEWDDPEKKTLLYTVTEATWTWDEYYAASAQAKTMMDESPHNPVHAIIDMSQAGMLPTNALSGFRRISSTPHSKAGMAVFVGVNRFIEMLFRTMAKIASDAMKSVRLLSTLEEARAFLSQQDVSETR